MAKRAFEFRAYTPTVNTDGTAITPSTYQAIAGGGPTQLVQVMEIYVGGQASASQPTCMTFSRNFVPATTPSALVTGAITDGFLLSNATSLGTGPLTFVSASTGPTRSTATTQARLNLSFNAFGGIVRWVAAPGEEWGILGTGANVETSLCAVTGSPGVLGTHIIYEAF